MISYGKAKIYKVVNNENDILYIGSTTIALSQRMALHRQLAHVRTSRFYSAMRELGIKNFSIKLIKDYPCDSKEELEAEEYRVMQELLDEGVELYNTNTVQGKMAESIKCKISAAKFRRGCISFCVHLKRWRFSYLEDGKLKLKSYGVKKWGDKYARFLAEVDREITYPCSEYGGEMPVLEP
jgi:hypothetical protein